MNINELYGFVEENIEIFHEKRIEKINKLKLQKLLKRKNPYLFKAKNILTAQEFVENLLSAHLSSQEEAIFGEILEKMAIFVNYLVYKGVKSSAEGIDLEFEKNNIRYIVSIKSGPYWGNSSSIGKLLDNFKKARRILNTNVTEKNVVAVIGCCYGTDSKPDKGEYLKLCGQDFWEFVSGDEYFYQKIIEPLGYKAKEKNLKFQEEYTKVINKFTREFTNNYCEPDGKINWNTILKLNSSKT